MILLASAVPSAHAGGPSGGLRYEGPLPMILSTHVDGAQYRLLIAGAHFGQRPLAITLGGRTLPVLKSSSTEIIAVLPVDLRSATYLLRISAADDLARADTFSLQVRMAETETGGDGEISRH